MSYSVEKSSVHIESALESLVLATLHAQKNEDLKRIRSSYSSSEFLKEFCTVRIGSSRRSGNTTALFKVGEKMFKNPIFIVSNSSFKNCASDSTRVFCASSVLPRGLEIDACFIDNASYIKNMEKIYDYLGPYVAGSESFCLVLSQ